jgi:hypothetical protein
LDKVTIAKTGWEMNQTTLPAQGPVDVDVEPFTAEELKTMALNAYRFRHVKRPLHKTGRRSKILVRDKGRFAIVRDYIRRYRALTAR